MTDLMYGEVVFDIDPSVGVSLVTPTAYPAPAEVIWCPWKRLTIEQQDRFLVLHGILAELTAAFDDVPKGPPPELTWDEWDE